VRAATLSRRSILGRAVALAAGSFSGSELLARTLCAEEPHVSDPHSEAPHVKDPHAEVAPAASERTPRDPRALALLELEQRSGGRLGVAVLDTTSGERFGHRAAERFPLCSTFKLLAVAAVLERVDRGKERLDRRIAYTQADLLEYAPVTRARLAEGSLSVAELCEAALGVSDNTAANLLLTSFGGPAALTAYARSLGDPLTRLDRNEPMLNEARPGDVRDTTTPSAMIGDLQALLLGAKLSKRSRKQLASWLVTSKTGLERLRAGVPPGWRVGDKTGSGNAGTTNDVAIVWPPGKKPVLIAAYLTESPASAELRNQVLADVGRLATQA
jgi:beta-lactamase class A